MRQPIYSLALSFFWLTPFFVLAFQAGKIYYRRRLLRKLSVNNIFDIINLLVIMIIAVRDITLLTSNHSDDVEFFSHIGPFVFFIILIAVIILAGGYLEKTENYLYLSPRQIVIFLMVIFLSVVVIVFIINGIDRYGPLIYSSVVINNEDFEQQSNKSNLERNIVDKNSRDKPFKSSIPERLFPSDISEFTASPIKHLSTNALTVWYQPDDPIVAEQSSGVTVFITHQKNKQKAIDFLKPSRSRAFPVDGQNINIGGQQMYQGFNQAQADANGDSRVLSTCLITWSRGAFTFEVYAVSEENIENNKELLSTLAETVAASIYAQSKGYFEGSL